MSVEGGVNFGAAGFFTTGETTGGAVVGTTVTTFSSTVSIGSADFK
jgi:hypothetical protein